MTHKAATVNQGSKRLRRTPGSASRRPVAAVLLTFAIAGLCLGLASSRMSADEVDQTRAILEKWIETRRIISKEQRDWALGRQMLSNRIELVQKEIESLRGKISETQASITEADKVRTGLIEQNERLKSASAALVETVDSLESGTMALLRRLPDPIRERVKPLSQRLPENPQETRLSLAERFQNVVGILNEVNKFNREITVTSEVRGLPDGTSVEVTALYLGIGQGYYLGANGRIAGLGAASDDGWVWTSANQAAEQISQVIAVLKNEQVASFVKLPIEIQ